MEHVVFFSEISGESEFRRVGDLDEAVRLVEALRNDRGIADVSLHSLTPIPVSFRTYYRVEVGVESDAAELDAFEADASGVDGAEIDAAETDAAEIAAPEIDALEIDAAENVPAESGAAEADADEVDAVGPEPVALLPVELVAVPSLELLAPPMVEVVEVLEPDAAPEVFEFGALADDELLGSSSAPEFDLDQELAGDDPDEVDQVDGLMSYEPLVPSVRPEPEGERTSLGYFAS